MKRDKIWDAVKGIGIILMVIGHSGCPAYMHDYIYLFHMGIFFFVSGKFLKINSGGGIVAFTKKKLKGLYLPFVKWGLIFTILHNVFYRWGWYDDRYTFLQTIKQMVLVFTFKSVDEQLIGPIWFVKSLFFGAVITYAICQLPKRWMQMALAVLFYLLSWFLGEKYYPYMINREFGVVIAIWLGYLLKSWNPINLKLYLPLSAAILAVMAFYVRIDVVGVVWGQLGAFPLLTLVGVVFVLNIVALCKKSKTLFSMFSFLGENSMSILVLHITAFHILSSVLMKNGYGTAGSLSNQKILSGIDYTVWFIPYTLVGVLVPLLYLYAKTTIGKVLLHYK